MTVTRCTLEGVRQASPGDVLGLTFSWAPGARLEGHNPMTNLRTITCSKCSQKFDGDEFGDSPAFDMHDCPGAPPVKQGESWEEYKKRCDYIEFMAAARRLQQDIEDGLPCYIPAHLSDEPRQA